ncbi:signal recognition particle-docking protein FtsY [Desulfovibrio ferrophilus]|uniref:Signal recognition particle receptor FtsY n=1 Tax=Desulfovibrio ferrophilus TaxID=241368 RepID=A0A2Z6B3H8_9BACT|nr:signal recognition particle-docking protein FtsY [Desulfovibrio ferrophilus]BBD09976.1 signal recognition particle-docking protein FtsY [Desulfovibrio ferrophilus]
MGFFSKLKFWQSKDDVEAPQAVDPELTPEEFLDASETTPAGADTETEPTPAQKNQPAAAQPAPEEQPAKAEEPWQAELTLALREAEPRLSQWLALVLEGLEGKGPELWQRLDFLFRALGAPEAEASDFIKRFDAWLDMMEYERVQDFRSELQYRLALALELEDEEDERSRLFLKLSEGLEKTKDKITRQIDGLLSSHDSMDEEFWEELEEILIMADVGFDATHMLVNNLRERARKADTNDPAAFKGFMAEELADLFKGERRITAVNPPEVVMVIGVNGVGKTTTIAKLAHRAQMQGKRVLVAAGDTFRAAAMEQLQVWAERVGAGFYGKGEGADPAAVAFEAVDYAIKERYDIIFVDTAGRLHTKVNLMEELKKIKNVLGKKHPGAPHRSILVVDATTGQNALSQTDLFSKAVGVDEIVLTKLDGTAKGGVVVAIALQFGVPITFVGLGERMEDLRPFNGQDFATALLGA